MVNHCPEQSECTDRWCERIAPNEDIPFFVQYICRPAPLTQADKDWAQLMAEGYREMADDSLATAEANLPSVPAAVTP